MFQNPPHNVKGVQLPPWVSVALAHLQGCMLHGDASCYPLLEKQLNSA